MLFWIDSRLRQATGRLQEPFGGVSVVILGDTKQLPPVKDRPLWSKRKKDEKQDIANGRAAFQLFQDVIILVENVRQGSPEQE